MYELDMLRIILVVLTLTQIAYSDDWTCWRGPVGNNHASKTTRIPTDWDLQTGKNILWKSAITGRGHSTPVVVGEGIFLTTADTSDDTQSLVKFDRRTGKLLGQWVIHRGGLPDRIHGHNSHASPTPAFDGKHIITVFHQNDAIMATAMTPAGEKVWQTRVSEFRPEKFQFGYGASPLVVGDFVIIAAEYDGSDSGLYALDTATGKQVWRVPRMSNLNFASPILADVGGQRSVLLAGASTISAYDAATGNQQWSVDATTEAICGTCVWDKERVIVSGGNPESGTWCVGANGRDELLWENPVMSYEQSLLVVGDHVYALSDNGVAYCWRTRDGKEMWRSRLGGGGVSASPLFADNKIIMAAEDGSMYVIAATPEKFELLREIRTGESIFASPVAIDDRLLVRTAITENGKRREYLVAIAGQ